MHKRIVRRSLAVWLATVLLAILLPMAGLTETVRAESIPGPVITGQPSNKVVEIGSVAKFTVTATGTGTLTYRWQSRKNEKTSWSNSGQSGANTKTLSVNAGATLHGWQFRCVVTDGNGQKVYSDAATLTVRPKIDTQPTDAYAPAGTTARFNIAVTGAGTLTYQWQSRKNADTTWTNSGQPGAETDTLLVNSIAGLHGWQFRCVVTDSNGQRVHSNAATLYVKLSFVEQPKNASATAGATAQFSVQVIGKTPYTYQWQSRKNADATWSNSGQPGSKTATLTVNTVAGLNGWQFRCVVKDAAGQTAVSGAATLSIVPKITSQPADASVVVDGTAKFTVAAGGKTPLTYQWQSRKNSSAQWSNSGQTGAKTTTLSVKALAGLDGWQFRCVVTDSNGQKSASKAATLRVLPKITKQPQNAVVVVGNVAEYTVAVAGKAPFSYQWQSRKGTSGTWSNSGQTGAKTATLSVTSKLGLNDWYFRCVITDANGQKVYSDAASILVTLGDVPINSENFPDDRFREFVQTKYDKDGDECLSTEERNAVNYMDIHSKSIANLQGIEFFTELWGLACYSNPLISLNLSRNVKLTQLDCAGAHLTSLNVSGCSNLNMIDCSFNPLETLNLSNNKKLQTLYCADTKITTVNTSGMTELESLYVYNGILEELDVSNNKNLKYLHCQGNRLKQLNVSANTLLVDLDCENNKITELDLTNNKALTKVTCDPGVNVIGADPGIIHH